MPVFAIILDAAGAEVQRARSAGTKLSFGITHHTMTAIRSVSMEHSPSGTMKGAAWGLWLAGPLGAAVGSMIGGGARVAFEVDVEGGTTLNCIGTKGEYLAAKRGFDAARLTAQQRASRRADWARRGRRPSFLLLVGMLALPVIFLWFFLRRDYRWLTRGIAAAWTVAWLAFFITLPSAPSVSREEPTTDAQVDEGSLVSPPSEQPGQPVGRQAEGEVTSESRAMTFDACLATIDEVSRQIGVSPISVVDTDIMRTVRIPTNDGSVLITCSRPDERMILTRSPHGQ